MRAAHRLHGDDTAVPLLARGGAKTSRLWTNVRDDRPWNGGAPSAAYFHFSRDRAATKPHELVTVATARRLVKLANAIIKTAIPWQVQSGE